MTDKQIIIDGVDVSGCEYFKINRGFNCYKGHNCTDKECYNCYYKQLKRSEAQCEGMFVSHTDLEKKYKAKEQECEFSNLRIIQLQETLSQYETDLSTKDCIVETCKAQYKELKAENEELKKWKENVIDLFNRTCKCKYLNEENAHCSFYNKECIAINQCLYKNQQTLAEIKEILQDNKEELNECLYNDIDGQILQKISECEVGNE